MLRSRFVRTFPAVFLSIALSGGTAFAQEPIEASQQLAPAGGTVTPSSLTGLKTEHQGSRFVSDLFKPLGSDMRGMVSRDNLWLAGIGGLGAVAGSQLDTRAAVYTWNSGFQPTMEPGKVAGSFILQTGGAFATYAIGRATNSEKVATVGASLFRAQVIAQTTTQTIKFAARRTRPDGTSLSFPSGHSASAFATASVLYSELGWKVGIPAFTAASWIAASRVHARRHFVSNVIAGATIGIMAGRSVTIGNGRARFAVTPMAVPRGGGVSFVKVGN